jgi:hypothetical protein
LLVTDYIPNKEPINFSGDFICEPEKKYLYFRVVKETGGLRLGAMYGG